MWLKLLTAVFFAVPFVITLLEGLYLYSAVIALSTTFSLLYHLKNERKYYVPDVLLSWVLGLTNLFFLYLSGFNYPYGLIVLLLALVSLFFWYRSQYFWYRKQKKKYNAVHSVWHVA